MDYTNLRYRRQFLLTHEPCAALSHWEHISVGNFLLYGHPDIELGTATSADMETTVALIGFIIDPLHPKQSNADILSYIANIGNSFERITNYLCSVSGRFVLIASTPEDTWLFHDPCGLRTVYYTQHKGNLLIGSQPTIFKNVMPLDEGERLSSYLQSTYAKTDLNHWIPSGVSLYEKVYHLVPNHALCFSTVEQVRYWPKQPIYPIPINEVVDKASTLLCKLVIAANKRFKLALPLTAGRDSRTLLSASKNISDKVYFYTLRFRDLNTGSSDIKIPRRLLQSLGLRHHVIDCRKDVPVKFYETYQQNTSPAHMNDWGKIAYGMIDTYPQERVCVKGNCSEITLCAYYKSGIHQEITSPDQLVSLVNGWNTIPFFRDPIAAWLSKAREASAQSNIDILDLFYWEHRMGSWQAQGQLEWDIVHEEYTPFNHRGLLEIMLSAPIEFRIAPDFLLHKMIMKSLWPEVMKEPINPITTKRYLLRILNRTGLIKFAKKVHTELFTNKT